MRCRDERHPEAIPHEHLYAEDGNDGIDEVQLYDVTVCSHCFTSFFWYLAKFENWSEVTPWGQGILLVCEDDLGVCHFKFYLEFLNF